MTLLAIDPGRSVKPSIGYALFDDQGNEIERGKLTWDGLVEALWLAENYDDTGISMLRFQYAGFTKDVHITEVVIENFVNNPRSARGGQENGTSECIGAVEFACATMRVPFTRQKSDKLGPARLLAGYEQTTEHLPDEDSAYLHGYYYLVGKGVLKSRGLESTL